MRNMNNHIVKADDNQPFHTSGYAQVATGNRMGSVSTMSFERRQQIEKNRQKINNYRQSVVGSYRTSLRAKSVVEGESTNRNAIAQRPSTTGAQPMAPAKPAPPPRFNPYG